MLADRLALPFDIDDRWPFIGNTSTFQLRFGLHIRASRETALHLIFTAIRWNLNNIFMKMAGDTNKRCGSGPLMLLSSQSLQNVPIWNYMILFYWISHWLSVRVALFDSRVKEASLFLHWSHILNIMWWSIWAQKPNMGSILWIL